jgi:serine/threonine-protein kinase
VVVPAAIKAQFPTDDLLGRVLAGKYALFSVLGKGGFGAVYKALQEPVNRSVAVKCIRKEIAHREGVRERFFREAQIVARINHPGAVTLFDYGEDEDGTLYMVFELLDGVPLSKALSDSNGPMEPMRASHIIRELLDALAEAHAQGAIHRDLKPENVMLVAGRLGQEHVKILDFGIAKVRSTDGDPNALTGADMVLGTPLYMAPEQATSGHIDERVDLYAVGVILYFMLSGHVPFAGATPFETLLAHREQPIPELPAEVEVPEALAAIVRKALQKYPEDRYADARSMAKALIAVIDSGSMVAAGDATVVGMVTPHLPSGDGSTSREWRGQLVETSPEPVAAGGGRRFPMVALAAAVVAGGAVGTWLMLRAPAVQAVDAGVAPVSIKLGRKLKPSSAASSGVASVASSGVASTPPSVAPSSAAPGLPSPFTEVGLKLAAGDVDAAATALVVLAGKAKDPVAFWRQAEGLIELAPALAHATVAQARTPQPKAPSSKAPTKKVPSTKAARRPHRRPVKRPARRPVSKAPAIDIETF